MVVPTRPPHFAGNLSTEPLGWVGLDPTNGIVADEGHPMLAIGRDHSGVSSLDRVIVASGAHSLTVAVDVIPLSEASGKWLLSGGGVIRQPLAKARQAASTPRSVSRVGAAKTGSKAIGQLASSTGPGLSWMYPRQASSICRAWMPFWG